MSRQLHPIGSELVNVWCCQGALTKAAEIVVTKIVSENVDDVRLFCGVAKTEAKAKRVVRMKVRIGLEVKSKRRNLKRELRFKIAKPWSEVRDFMRKFSGHEFQGDPVWGTTSSTWIKYVAPQESKK